MTYIELKQLLDFKTKKADRICLQLKGLGIEMQYVRNELRKVCQHTNTKQFEWEYVNRGERAVLSGHTCLDCHSKNHWPWSSNNWTYDADSD